MALAAAAHHRRARRGCSTTGAYAGKADWVVIDEDRSQHPFTVDPQKGFFLVCEPDAGMEREIAVEASVGALVFHCTINGRERVVQIDRRRPAFRMTHQGASFEVLVVSPRVAEHARHMPVKEAPDLSSFLLSPMPGLLVSLAVSVGQEVKTGEELAVVEAMKMENILRAQRDGKVSAIHVEPGASLAVDEAILEFE